MAAVTSDPIGDQQYEQIAPSRPSGVDFDVYLVLVVAALLAFGLLMVYSTTFDWSYLQYGSPIRIFLRQVRSLLVGLVALVLAWRVDYRILRDRRVAALIMLMTILALGGLLLLVNNAGFGAQRSLYQGSYQPGELAKLATIIYFSAWLASRREQLHKIGYGLIPFSLLVGAVGSLVVLQPDLSTAAVIVLTAWTMFFLAGANIFQILLAGVGAGVVGWSISTQFDYARQRLLDHVTSMQDLTQASWHVQQAIIAFTAPGTNPDGTFSHNWFGVGLGQSRQKFGFLPAAHTDSIFAIIGEELGLFGCLVVILLFALFVWRGFKIASEAPDPFGSILAAGITSWIIFDAILNIAVMTAIMPFTGVSLPFISYGGSSLVVVMTGVGLLMNISRVRPREIRYRQQTTDHGLGRTDRNRRITRVGRTGQIDY
jgi:cell division protein FtsW